MIQFSLLLFVSDGRDEDSQSAMAFIIGVAIAVIIIILVIIVVGILCCRRSRYTVCMLPKSLKGHDTYTFDLYLL